MSRDLVSVDNVGDRPETSQMSNRDISSEEMRKQIAVGQESPFHKVHNEMSLDHMRSIDDISSIISINENSSNGSRGHKVSNLVNPIDVLPESETQASLTDGNGFENREKNNIKEGSHVEVVLMNSFLSFSDLVNVVRLTTTDFIVTCYHNNFADDYALVFIKHSWLITAIMCIRFLKMARNLKQHGSQPIY
jgi:hypothetical protein